MTASIEILDNKAANQIAAGEVVERPVSVVKELVENALDASAKHIEIIVEGNGVPLIKISDDGVGILPDDLPRTVLRHATSKIRRIEDLEDLRTLGFRGEAIPSIASVAKMEILSRPRDNISGNLLLVEGGEIIEMKESGCPPGTTVTVKDLFYNTPARRKFLKSANTEFGQISDCIGRLSMARPDVAFTLKHPKNIVLQTPGRGRLIEAIGQVLGKSIARRLIPISFSQGDWVLEGYVSPPDLVRSTRNAETFIVNGRIVRSNVIQRAISEGYHTLIPNKLYPIVVLNLKISPAEYDVNVHPTKMEIRFHKEKELANFISTAIRKKILDSKPLAPFDRIEQDVPIKKDNPIKNNTSVAQYTFPFKKQKNSSYNQSMGSANHRTTSFDFLIPSPSPQNNHDHVKEVSITNEVNETNQINEMNNIKTYSTSDFSHVVRPNLEPIVLDEKSLEADIKTNGPTELEKPADSRESLLALHPIGQLFNTYILATDGEELVIIDQHAAHERINYEKLLRKYRNSELSSQRLLMPISMEFTPAEEEVLLENIMHLDKLGFILEEFGGHTYLLRGVPAYSGSYQGDELLCRFIDLVIEEKVPPSYDKLLEEWIYMLACKESIKAKEVLSTLEMEQLIISLSNTDNPYTCPHGRPTMIKLTRGELERRFYRT